ncbi:MAG: Gfo/Idh/MocA family oxidoreductase [Bdellovibrionales bacterium]|nr:Gfo/Idh/MocA family oxidoreductase [Bdellovibrionales bacterium]
MIRAAVIGTGYLGKFHAEKYAKSANAELVAVVDSEPGVAKTIAKKYRTKAMTDYRELLDLGIQCVSVASVTSSHFGITKWLLENGIDVLVEKPMCVTLEEGAELIRCAEENQRILQVGHLERFNPAFREMRKVLTKPWFFEVRRIAPFTGRGADVDVVLDLMIHDIDIVTHLVGEPVERIDAVGIPVLTDQVDIANARLVFQGGAIANVSASRAAFASERTIRIFQPELYISLDFGKKRLKICTKGEGKDLLGFPRIDVTERTVEERDALADEIESFIRCVTNRTAPEVTGADGLRALQLATRIKAAFREGMEKMLPENPEAVRAVL